MIEQLKTIRALFHGLDMDNALTEGGDVRALEIYDALTQLEAMVGQQETLTRIVTTENQEPMFWVRLCSDGMYEGPIHNAQIERVRAQSGAWSPLFLGAAPVAQQPQAEAVHEKEDLCYCNDEISLQIVSGGAAPEGLYGRVTLKVNGEYVNYVKAPPAARSIGEIAGVVEAAQKPILEDVASLCETIRYMVGIAERGTGSKCPDDMRPEVFLLNYVKQLEAVEAPQQAEAVPGRAFLERTLAAMEGVIDVADRKTDEFDKLRACTIDLTLMLYAPAVSQPQAEAVPPGYALVPVEPTQEMLEAGKTGHYEAECKVSEPGAWGPHGFANRKVRVAHVYRAMIDAAIAQQKGDV